MKKIGFFFIILFSACVKSVPVIQVEKPDCSEFSVECELQKRYVVIRPLSFLHENRAKDAYGAPVDTGWYAINMDNPGVLLPINLKEESLDGTYHHDMIKRGVKNGRYKIDTLPSAALITLQLKEITAAQIVCAGKTLFTFSSNSRASRQGDIGLYVLKEEE